MIYFFVTFHNWINSKLNAVIDRIMIENVFFFIFCQWKLLLKRFLFICVCNVRLVFVIFVRKYFKWVLYILLLLNYLNFVFKLDTLLAMCFQLISFYFIFQSGCCSLRRYLIKRCVVEASCLANPASGM